jgi:hypothetical protein
MKNKTKFTTRQAEALVRLVAGQDPYMRPEDFIEGEKGTDRYAVQFGYDPVEKRIGMVMRLNRGHPMWERPPPSQEDAVDLAAMLGRTPLLLKVGPDVAGAYTAAGEAACMYRSPGDHGCWMVTLQPNAMYAEEGMLQPGLWISCLKGIEPRQMFALLKV